MWIDETTLETKYFLVQLSEHSIFEILQIFFVNHHTSTTPVPHEKLQTECKMYLLNLEQLSKFLQIFLQQQQDH